MPVFDFGEMPEKGQTPECTYTVFQSDESEMTPEKPVMLLDNTETPVETSFLWCVYQSGQTDCL